MTATHDTSANGAADERDDEQIVQQYNRLRQEQSATMSRIAELENESHEHALVVEELRLLSADRCCHRLVGGALVQRTVGEVLPELEANVRAINDVLANLHKSLLRTEEQMSAFVTRHRLSTRAPDTGHVTSPSADVSRGVLA